MGLCTFLYKLFMVIGISFNEKFSLFITQKLDIDGRKPIKFVELAVTFAEETTMQQQQPLGCKRDATGQVKHDTQPSSIFLEEQLLLTNIPLWRVPYEDQVKEKTENAITYLIKLCDLILTRNPNLTGYIQRERQHHKGLMCRVDPMLRTCNPSGYRANAHFRIAVDEKTGVRVVGLAGTKRGMVSVRPGDSMLHLPHQMKLVVKLMEDYVRLSPLPPYSPDSKTGFWRLLTVRVSLAGEVMMTVGCNAGDITDQQLQYVKSDLTNFFFNGDGRLANVHSLYYNPIEDNHQEGTPGRLELLAGVARLIEPVLGTNFHVGPMTHFTNNTCTAQTVHQALDDLIQPGPHVTLIEICSGIATCALILAKKCGEVYAIEQSEQHISDGVITAQMNGIANFSFLHGRAEDQLADLLHTLEPHQRDIVCVLDPPKLGSNKRTAITDLAFKIVEVVRQSPSVRRFVYICNNQKVPVRLFLDFCASPLERGTYRFAGLPFVPVRVIPVDVAPHTPHYQLFVLFERCTWTGSKKKTRKQRQSGSSSGSQGGSGGGATTLASYVQQTPYC